MRRKRDRRDFEGRALESSGFGMGDTLSRLHENPDDSADRPATSRQSGDSSTPTNDHDKPWQKVEGRAAKKQKNKSKDKIHQSSYPTITHSASARLQTHVKISDFQSLVLYLLADGTAPQWVSVRHHHAIRKVVALMVPGLEAAMFDGRIPLSNAPPGEDAAAHDVAEKTQADGRDDGLANVNTNVMQNFANRKPLSPDDYYPVKLETDHLPYVLKPLAKIFPHLWPVKTPGDDKYSRIHSPLQAMLTAPLHMTREEKKQKGPTPAKSQNWENKRTPVTDYLMTTDQLQEHEYVLHPVLFSTLNEKDNNVTQRRATKQAAENGWVDTDVMDMDSCKAPDNEVQMGSLTAGMDVIAMDCEMCKTDGDTFELTRISLIGWDGSILLDELVKPDKPIVDYLTPYSGMTKEMLDPITTTLSDIQKRILELFTPRTVLVGHSLNADLTALKLTHPLVVDTAVIYPHPRGPPLKSSLKWLVQKYLHREIQKNHGTLGHDSIEDARACLDLVKQKCEKGPKWGTSEASGEPIFKRLGRSLRPKQAKSSGAGEEFRTGAVVDWGDPRRGLGSQASMSIGCGTDADVVEGIKRAVTGDAEGAHPGGVDFVWGRLRELEAVRGWWSSSKTADNDELRANALSQGQSSTNGSHGNQNANGSRQEPTTSQLTDAVRKTVAYISEIHASLPPCTAFIIYSGTGDPRETTRLQAMQQQFKKEYQVKKWDQLSVKWTDTEEQALKKACRKAREGVGFVVVK